MKPQTFASFEGYAAAIQHTNLRVTLLGPPSRPWKAAHLPLLGLTLQWGEDGGPAAFEGAVAADGWMIFLPLSSPSEMIANDVRFDRSSCMVLAPCAEFCTVNLGPARWVALYILNTLLPFEQAGIRSAGAEPCKMLRAPESEIAHFVGLVGRIIEAAENNVFARNPQLALAAASAELLTAVRRLLAAPPTAGSRHGQGSQRASHAAIISTALQALHESEGLSVPIQDLANVANVSERTLRNAFYERFGISPHRYARLAALNAARRLLQNVDPQKMGVTEIATQLGFWQFGRFSHDYRALFGELPSKTLHQRGRQHSLAAQAH